MRILHLISSSGLFGAERVVLELSKALVKQGHHPVIGVLRNSHNPHTEITDEAKEGSIDNAVFPCRGQFDVKLVSSIREFIRRNRVDLVHCHGYKSNFYGILASKNLAPSVATNHNWIKSNWRLKAYCLVDRRLIRRFSRVVAVSDVIKEEMLRVGVPEEKIRVIYNGVDADRLNATGSSETLKKELGLEGTGRIVGTIGGLIEEKGYGYLLRAAKEIIGVEKGVKFLIVGDGPLNGQLRDMARGLGIEDSVIFTGYRKDVPDLLSVMDIYILPSVREGLPMVLLEAMAAGKPVIASRVGAVPKVVIDNESGVLITPSDVGGIKKAVLDLIRDEPRAKRLGLMGNIRLKEKFSSDVMAGEYMSVYGELVPGKRAAVNS